MHPFPHIFWMSFQTEVNNLIYKVAQPVLTNLQEEGDVDVNVWTNPLVFLSNLLGCEGGVTILLNRFSE